MRFSIIVPIFRVEKYLRECINSIINQSFTDFELILVDDGSDDECPTICDEYQKMYNTVFVLHKENGGLVSARKAGSDIASGEYILNIDGDDWIESDYLERINQAIIKSNFSDVVIWGSTISKPEKKREERIWTYSFGNYSENKMNEIRYRYLYDKDKTAVNSGSVSINLVTKAVKRDFYILYQNLIPDDVTKGEDALLSLYLLKNANSAYYLEYYGYNYRYVEESMSNRIDTLDFERLESLVANMKMIVEEDTEMHNQIKAYALWRLIGLLSTLARKAKKYKDFLTVVQCINPSFINYATSVVIGKPRLKDYIKVITTKNRMWFFIYYVLKLI